jgi:hypothetical protein
MQPEDHSIELDSNGSQERITSYDAAVMSSWTQPNLDHSISFSSKIGWVFPCIQQLAPHFE